MIEKLKTYDTYDGFTYPSPREMMDKINEIIDCLSNLEKSRMTAGTGGSDATVYPDHWQGSKGGGQGGCGRGSEGIIQRRNSDGSVFFIGGGIK